MRNWCRRAMPATVDARASIEAQALTLDEICPNAMTAAALQAQKGPRPLDTESMVSLRSKRAAFDLNRSAAT